MNKVVILNDNPKRDLLGNLLLSLELLKKKNIKVFLTPFNLTEKEILNIEPNIIIFNYLRFQNSKLVSLAIKKKIKVIILDTEGGAFENDKDFTNSIYYKPDYDNKILYLCWGKVYENYLKKKFPKMEVVATGHPRFDIYKKKNFNLFRKKNGKHILFCSRVSVANPKFSSIKNEINTFRIARNASIKEVKNFYKIQKNELSEQIKLVKKISNDFKNEKIIFRAHPFENEKLYEKAFKNLPNIEVNNKNHLSSWLANSHLCIQRGCTSGLEAAVAKIPSLSPDWGKFLYTTNIDKMNINHFVKNYDELKKIIKKIINLNNKKKIFKKNKPNKKIVKDYFYSFDGNSSKRVSKQIFKVLKDNKKSKKFIFYKVKQIVKKILMIQNIIESSYIRSLEKWDSSIKSYSEKDIETILNLLAPIIQKKIHIRKLSAKNNLLRSISLENV
jgi:surface carbohydrate biosynthesis protein